MITVRTVDHAGHANLDDYPDTISYHVDPQSGLLTIYHGDPRPLSLRVWAIYREWSRLILSVDPVEDARPGRREEGKRNDDRETD